MLSSDAVITRPWSCMQRTGAAVCAWLEAIREESFHERWRSPDDLCGRSAETFRKAGLPGAGWRMIGLESGQDLGNVDV